MSATVKTDKSEKLIIKSRVNEDGQPITLIFVDENDDPVDISAKDWQIPVRKTPSSTTDLFLLEEGSGITVGGADNNELQIDLTEENATLKPGVYFLRLFSVTENKTWLNGFWHFHDGSFGDVTTSETITINNGATNVTITIREGGTTPTTVAFTNFSAAGGTFPTDEDYTLFVISVAGTIAGLYCAAGDVLMRYQNSPTSDWTITGWKKF